MARRGDREGRGERGERDVRKMVDDILSGEYHPYVRQGIEQTPSTGHWEGSAKKMIREIDNWPDAWIPRNSPARALLKQAIAQDADESYVYYPIGNSRPVIWYKGRRMTLGEFQAVYG